MAPHNEPNNEREFIERRINELDRRRDANLKEKLDAIEKYFNLSVTTKSEALNIAISRIQGENKDCAARCANQIKTFYDMIHSLRDKDTVQMMTLDSLKLEIVNIKTELDEIYSTMEANQIESNNQKLASKDELNTIKTDIKDQAKDLKRIPLKVFVISSIVGVAIVELVIKVIVWVFKTAAKSGGLGI